MSSNPFLLAADNSAALLPLLRDQPSLASSQDEHGYSLVHAAASYNHIDLLHALIREFKVDVDLKDEDDETALFVVETQEAARVLVEELGANPDHKNADGLTAREKLERDGDFPPVVEYLSHITSSVNMPPRFLNDSVVSHAAVPPPPEGLEVRLGTMNEAQDVPADVDPEFRRRIEELAQRSDFDTAEGQAELRRLITDALTDQGLGDERSVKSKQG